MMKAFTAFANLVSRVAGRPYTFIVCIALVTAWAVSGPLFKFSDTWQLVINTSTTIITFLMVFLIQNTQNRDNSAIQAKLDELVRAAPKAANSFIGIEHLTDQELERILKQCEASIHARRVAPKPGAPKGPGAPELESTAPKRKAAPRKRKVAAT